MGVVPRMGVLCSHDEEYDQGGGNSGNHCGLANQYRAVWTIFRPVRTISIFQLLTRWRRKDENALDRFSTCKSPLTGIHQNPSVHLVWISSPMRYRAQIQQIKDLSVTGEGVSDIKYELRCYFTLPTLFGSPACPKIWATRAIFDICQVVAPTTCIDIATIKKWITDKGPWTPSATFQYTAIRRIWPTGGTKRVYSLCSDCKTGRFLECSLLIDQEARIGCPDSWSSSADWRDPGDWSRFLLLEYSQYGRQSHLQCYVLGRLFLWTPGRTLW